MISMIWAMDENRLIGKGNLLPWHYKKDLEYFKKMTKNQTVLMGDLTYQSLKTYYKVKPLPFKKIYVANHSDACYPDAECITDLVTFLTQTKEDLFIIGGLMIYKLSLPFAHRLYITYVLNRHQGNVYFPIIDMTPFKLINYQIEETLIFATYERSSQ